MKRLAIIGAGELGKQIFDIATSVCEFEVVGFFDDYADSNDVDILGKLCDIEKSYIEGKFDCIVIAIGYKHLFFKKKLFEELKGKIPFATIIHKSCIINPKAKIGEGSVLYPGCIVDKNVQINDNVLLNLGVIVAHDTIINSHSFIAPGVVFSGFVQLGECSFIGSNSTFVDNVSVTANVFVGAGSLINKNLSVVGKYIGSPVKLISD